MIFTPEQIAENWLYDDVMREINNLHDELGEPEEFENGENRRATTGNYRNLTWNSGDIGEWDGDEEFVAAQANDMLSVVYRGLGYDYSGGISHYYASARWNDFTEQADAIIDSFHENDAYEKMCDNYEKFYA